MAGEEKMMILKMLEEGKINAEEAARLMEASEGRVSSHDLNQKRAAMSDAGSFDESVSYGGGRDRKRAERVNDGRYQGPEEDDFDYPPMGGIGLGLDGIAGDLGRKIETLKNDMEPMISRLKDSVAETTASMAERLTRSISGTAGEFRVQPPVSGGHMEEAFELKVLSANSELNLSGHNGDISISGYNGDKISVQVYYRSRFHGAELELMKLGDKYFLNYDKEAFDFVSIDACVPDKMFKTVRVQGMNGNMTIVGIEPERAFIELLNGDVFLKSFDIERLRISSDNGALSVSTDRFERYEDYFLEMSASNGKFTLALPRASQAAYSINAKAALSKVSVGLSDLEYHEKESSRVTAKSPNFDRAKKKVTIYAETSNAPLIIE